METTNTIATPALVVNRSKLEANCQKMLAWARERGVRLRPHIKTHKTLEGALCQLRGTTNRSDFSSLTEEDGICVSTLGELRFFASSGFFRSILFAIPLSAHKLDLIHSLHLSFPVCHLISSHHITSHHITLHHISSHLISSHLISSPPDLGLKGCEDPCFRGQ